VPSGVLEHAQSLLIIKTIATGGEIMVTTSQQSVVKVKSGKSPPWRHSLWYAALQTTDAICIQTRLRSAPVDRRRGLEKRLAAALGSHDEASCIFVIHPSCMNGNVLRWIRNALMDKDLSVFMISGFYLWPKSLVVR